jgi:hypothetical protein
MRGNDYTRRLQSITLDTGFSTVSSASSATSGNIAPITMTNFIQYSKNVEFHERPSGGSLCVSYEGTDRKTWRS